MHRSRNSTFGERSRRSKDTITEEEIARNLLQLLETTQYSMVQENGQRRYGGPCPGWDGQDPPSNACEIFVSQIPETCFEDVLVPIFSTVGKIYELRLMLDFDGGHRGFAFVKYTRPEHAAEAVRRLDKFKLPMSKRGLRVTVSRNSCELEINNVPPGLERAVEDLVRGRTADVTCVRRLELRLLVEYETHRAAAIARRLLLSALPDVCGRDDVRVQLLQRTLQGEEPQVNQKQSPTLKPQPVVKHWSHYPQQMPALPMPYQQASVVSATAVPFHFQQPSMISAMSATAPPFQPAATWPQTQQAHASLNMTPQQQLFGLLNKYPELWMIVQLGPPGTQSTC